MPPTQIGSLPPTSVSKLRLEKGEGRGSCGLCCSSAAAGARGSSALTTEAVRRDLAATRVSGCGSGSGVAAAICSAGAGPSVRPSSPSSRCRSEARSTRVCQSMTPRPIIATKSRKPVTEPPWTLPQDYGALCPESKRKGRGRTGDSEDAVALPVTPVSPYRETSASPAVRGRAMRCR